MTIAKLSQLPLAIAPDEPDLLGWPVHGSDERLVGTVIDLLVQRESRDVRYLVIQLTNGLDIALPLGMVSLIEGEADARVLVQGLTSAEIRRLEPLPPEPYDVSREKQLYGVFLPHRTVDYDRPEFRWGGQREFQLQPMPKKGYSDQFVPSPEGWRKPRPDLG